MMDLQCNLLVIALLFVSFMIWQAWEQDKNLQPQAQQTMQTMTTAVGSAADQGVLASGQGKLILVKTDVLDLTINTCGGDVEQALLPAYLKELNSTQLFQLLETSLQFIYQAQSGLTGCDGLDNLANGLCLMYNVEKDAYVLAEGQNELQVLMMYTDVAGNMFTKMFVLKCGDYAVNVNYNVQNAGEKLLEISTFGQLKQSITLPLYLDTGSSNFALHTFCGVVYSMPDEKYEKYKFDTIADNENLNISLKGGWVAMLQQYFAMVWILHNDGTNNFYTANLGNGIAAIGYKSQLVLVQPGQTGVMNSTLWVGLEIQDKMAAVALHLDLTVDYGWLWFISQLLFKLLKWIHSFVGNWGFSIIIITFIVCGIMYLLTKAQYTSMAKMCMLQLKIQAMCECLGDDKQCISQEMMVLYKAEKVNLLGGCFLLLIQMPIFLVLYYMLMGSVELCQALFALWIHDLLAQDLYYILLILMGVMMFFIQKMLLTTVTDLMQQKIMTFMLVIFTVFFLWFLSGLVLYYIVSNLVTIIQQQLIYCGLEKCGLHSCEKKKS